MVGTMLQLVFIKNTDMSTKELTKSSHIYEESSFKEKEEKNFDGNQVTIKNHLRPDTTLFPFVKINNEVNGFKAFRNAQNGEIENTINVSLNRNTNKKSASSYVCCQKFRYLVQPYILSVVHTLNCIY